MSALDFHYITIQELTTLFKTKQASPVEVTRYMLSRIAELDPKLHSYARLTPDRALEAAKVAEKRYLAGEIAGPLAGVPIAVKDNFDTSDVVTANGMYVHRNRVPKNDSTSVRRLEGAGGVLLGKLQQTEGAFAEHHKTNSIPINPWSADHWAGASSSGSGVAPAAGLTFASLGTDTGGSVRFPCAANGLTGIKPTWGRVSRHGVYPNSPSMDHVGPMARSVEDVAIILETIAGEDPFDPTASDMPVPRYLATPNRSLSKLRVAIDPKYAYGGVPDETVDCIKQAINILAGFDIEVEEASFPNTEQVIKDWMPMSGVEMAAAHDDIYDSNREHYGAALTGLIELGRQQKSTDFQKLLMRRHEFRGLVDKFFTKYDVLIVPTNSTLPQTNEDMAQLGKIEGSLEALIRYTCPFDMTGSPTLILPCGLSKKGMPMSFQLVGRHFDEQTLFDIGFHYQSVTTWHRQHPPTFA